MGLKTYDSKHDEYPGQFNHSQIEFDLEGFA